MNEGEEFFNLAGVECYGPGEQATDPQPGDFILTHQTDWSARLVQFGQKLRYHGSNSKYTHWNHTALIADAEHIIEALGRGVSEQPLSKYNQREYHLVRIAASPEDRQEAVNFARACCKRKMPYGYLTVISIAISLLTGTKFSFGFDGQMICSGLVARALERTTAIFVPDTSHIMPAYLAKSYGVEPQKTYTPALAAAKTA